jgi:serine/threonine-protein kinase
MAARFRSEIKLARKVSHWNVCRIHEYGEDGSLQYISMELITGATLKDRLRPGPLPVAEAYEIAVQMAEGLGAIHKVGIIHRDLKSANVMIAADGTAKLMDFGIAKAAGAEGASTGYVLGSPEYMSPEQARGRHAEFRSDIYSLGVVVFEAFTGRVPFRGATPVATLMMHVETPPPIDDPSLHLPPALVRVLRRALAKDPAERFPDAGSMSEALRAARDEGRGPARPGAPLAPSPSADDTLVVHTRRRPPRGGRGRALAVGAALALAAVIVAGVLMKRGPASSGVPSTLLSPSPLATPPLPSASSSPSYTLVPTTTLSAPSAGVAMSPAVVRTPPATATTPRPLASTGPSTAPAPAEVPTPVAPSTTPAASPSPPAAEAPVPSVTAPPTVAPTPAVGWLLVLAVPWAEITVDGRPAGQTPLDKFPLAPGAHAVMLTHPSYRAYQRKVTIRPGEKTEIRFNFEVDGVRRR